MLLLILNYLYQTW